MTDPFGNMHFDEAGTQPTEECTSLPEFKQELGGILVEGALIDILYALMECTDCDVLAKNLLAYLQDNDVLTVAGEDTRGRLRKITIYLDPEETGDVVISDLFEAQFGTVYSVACKLIHGNIWREDIFDTELVSGLRAEHHYRQPYWWYDVRDKNHVGNKIIEKLMAYPDCSGCACVAEV